MGKDEGKGRRKVWG